MPINREITVINKSESRPSSLPDKIEQWCKIVSIVAIPLVLALIGYFVNARLQNQTVSQKYLEIAITILQNPLDSNQDESQQMELKKWAVDLLDNSSPIELSKDLPNAFIKGTLSLPETRLRSEETQALKNQLIQQQFSRLQSDFFNDFPNNLEAAEETIDYTLRYFNDIQRVFPDEPFLQNIFAYTYKNRAMVMRELGNNVEFEESLEKSENAFNGILDNNPRDAGAWNGLGSVALLRNDPKTALQYIEKALDLIPNYRAAIHDREIALRMLKKQENQLPDGG